MRPYSVWPQSVFSYSLRTSATKSAHANTFCLRTFALAFPLTLCICDLSFRSQLLWLHFKGTILEDHMPNRPSLFPPDPLPAGLLITTSFNLSLLRLLPYLLQ